MKIKNNYIECSLSEFTSLAITFVSTLKENPQLADSVQDPEMLVRVNNENMVEMGYKEDFAYIV